MNRNMNLKPASNEFSGTGNQWFKQGTRLCPCLNSKAEAAGDS